LDVKPYSTRNNDKTTKPVLINVVNLSNCQRIKYISECEQNSSPCIARHICYYTIHQLLYAQKCLLTTEWTKRTQDLRQTRKKQKRTSDRWQTVCSVQCSLCGVQSAARILICDCITPWALYM